VKNEKTGEMRQITEGKERKGGKWLWRKDKLIGVTQKST